MAAQNHVRQFFFQKKSHIKGNLIVPASSCMELLSRVANFLNKPRFYMHMDVFQSVIKDKHPRLDFFLYFIEALHDAVFS